MVPSKSVAKCSSPTSTPTALPVDGSVATSPTMWAYQPSTLRAMVPVVGLPARGRSWRSRTQSIVDRTRGTKPHSEFESAVRRKVIAAKVVIGIEANTPISKRTQRTVSKNCEKNATAVVRLRARIASIRADSTHKLTTCLCRLNQAVLIEDLHVKGKLANNKRARSLGKRGF